MANSSTRSRNYVCWLNAGACTTTPSGHTLHWATGRRLPRHGWLPTARGMGKWKPLRASHFPTPRRRLSSNTVSRATLTLHLVQKTGRPTPIGRILIFVLRPYSLKRTFKGCQYAACSECRLELALGEPTASHQPRIEDQNTKGHSSQAWDLFLQASID
jgi:hypothetical protein